MYGRNKVDSFDTINLCNQFLILYLAKKAQAFQNRGLTNNSRVYRNAIYSIKRYPLPIICKAQLESINGIGEFLGEELQKVIKNHYSAFLDSNLKQKNQEHENEWNQQQALNDSFGGQKDNVENQQGKFVDNTMSRSNTIKSVTSQYKPRINTANSYFLQMLSELSGKQGISSKSISYEIIHPQILKKYPATKNKSWKLLQQTLQQNEYISIERTKQEPQSKQIKFYRLTQKGISYNQSVKQKTKQNQTKDKIINHVKEFKEQIQNGNNSNSNKTPSLVNTFCVGPSQFSQHQNDKLSSKTLECKSKQIQLDKLVLMIDMRQKNQKTESHFFIQKITKKYGIKCQNVNLNLGDFIWTYDNKVLDYIIQRKKADDLAASILDGRYKDQKYRLNECKVNHVYYIYEGYPSDNCCLTQKELNNALLKTRTKEKFKVCKTKDINQTMKLLNTFHLQIYDKIVSNKAKYLCTFEQFNQLNSIQRNFTVGKIFALGLMSIPGVGKNSISVLTQYFKTYKVMYDYLSRLESNNDRVQFLKNLFKGSGMMNSLPGILVDLLFSESYSNQKYLQTKEKNAYHSDSISISQSYYQRTQQQFQQQFDFFEKKRFSVIHQQQQLNSDHDDQQEEINI